MNLDKLASAGHLAKSLVEDYLNARWSYDDRPEHTATEWHEIWQETDSAYGFYYDNARNVWVMHDDLDRDEVYVKYGKVYEVTESFQTSTEEAR